MSISISELKYYLTNFRTRCSYLIFQSLQLGLSFVIIVLALFSEDHFREKYIIGLEFVLMLLMGFDLLVIRWISQGSLWTSCNNKVDCIILAIFAVTFIFLCVTQEHNKAYDYKQVLLETDDIVLIVVIMTRYSIQIYQMIKTIKNTRRNMKMQKNMKDVDLNVEPHSAYLEDNQMKCDEIMRSKIGKKSKEEEGPHVELD